MLKLDLQLFAHKKGMGSTKNGRDSESKRLGATSFIAKEELTFIRATMLVSVLTIHFMLSSTELLSSRRWARIEKRFLFTLLSNNFSIIKSTVHGTVLFCLYKYQLT